MCRVIGDVQNVQSHRERVYRTALGFARSGGYRTSDDAPLSQAAVQLIAFPFLRSTGIPRRATRQVTEDRLPFAVILLDKQEIVPKATRVIRPRNSPEPHEARREPYQRLPMPPWKMPSGRAKPIQVENVRNRRPCIRICEQNIRGFHVTMR